jgi:ribonuclease III
MPDINGLEIELGIKMKTPVLLERALVHSSFINENPTFTIGHNERLEFLGDAVLDAIVAEKLYRDNPTMDEGEMTRLRAAIVRRDTLASVARKIKLGDYLLIGKGEEVTGGRDKAPNLASALEAVIAAVYLDHGLEATVGMVVRLIGEILSNVMKKGTDPDYKSRLQEITQSRFQITPSYRMVDEAGPDHAKSFTVEVAAGKGILGKGTGNSKKLAETEAARVALEKLKGDFTE